jgi:hypothetical protein
MALMPSLPSSPFNPSVEDVTKWRANLANTTLLLPGPEIVGATGYSVLIVVYPGALKNAGQYVELSTRLQNKLEREGIQAHFALPSFLNDFPTGVPGDADAMFDAAIGVAKEQGWAYNHSIVLAHSAGGYVSADTVLTKASIFIQMGCTFNSKGKLTSQGLFASRSLSSFPKPVLTLLGSRDGYFRFHVAAGEFEDLGLWGEESDETSISKKLSLEQLAVLKPVVILDEVSFMTFNRTVLAHNT